jgi:hypothetical protein
MQQQNQAQSQAPQNTPQAASFMQRLLDWGAHAPTPQPQPAPATEDATLDQRVRQSGEW